MEFVWYFYFLLHAGVKWLFLPFSFPSLSLFCFFPVVFLDLRYIGMKGQSAVCARFVALSFFLSHIHFYHICWCAIVLFYFGLFSAYILVMG